MNIYPAIDLKSGECVRLFKGSFDRVTSYQKDPVAVAKSFVQQGAKFLHVVDLDAAKDGSSNHLPLILNILQATGVPIQIGGGIRNKARIKELIHHGIARIILGSVALSNSKEVKEWLQEFGPDRITLALDIRMNGNEPQLASHGWQINSHISVWKLLEEYKDSSLIHVLCTDIDRDGTLQGPNIALYHECIKRYPSLQFQASGGIGRLTDLHELAKIPVSSVIVGKALYENKFSLQDAFESVEK